MRKQLIILVLIFFAAGCTPSYWRQDPAKKLLREGFKAFDQAQVIIAEEKWSQAIGILKQRAGTDKEQADNLTLMGNYLKRIGRQRDALNKFSHALSLYRDIADIDGQKTCISAIEEISPEAIAMLGRQIYKIPTPPEDRVKFDKDGYMVGREPDALLTDAMIKALEKKQDRTEEEEGMLRSLQKRKKELDKNK